MPYSDVISKINTGRKATAESQPAAFCLSVCVCLLYLLFLRATTLLFPSWRLRFWRCDASRHNYLAWACYFCSKVYKKCRKSLRVLHMAARGHYECEAAKLTQTINLNNPFHEAVLITSSHGKLQIIRWVLSHCNKRQFFVL